MKPGRVFFGVVLVALACGRGLPSTKSLGGKLDDESEQPRAPDRRAKGTSAEADAGAAPAPVAKTEDAGAPSSEGRLAEKAQPPADAGADAATSGDAAASVSWAGEYVGSDVTKTRFEGMPERVQPDDKARTRVEESGTNLKIIIVDSSNGNTLCTLNAEARGASATIAPNQSCFGTDEMTATVVAGSASLTGDRLVFDLEVKLEVEADDAEMTGEISYHFDGKRR